MNKTESNTAPVPWLPRLALTRLLLLLAIALTAYLLYLSLRGDTSGVPGCGASGFGCDHVLGSRWAYWLAIPVSAPALVVQITTLAATFHARRRGAWFVMLAGATALLGSAIWFTWLQFARLEAICPYCLAAHAAGSLAAALLVSLSPRRQTTLVAGPVGLVAVAALILGQVFGPAPAVRVVPGEDFDTGPGPDRQMSVLGGTIRFNPHQFPILGSPDARTVIVSLSDYTCKHCRAMHGFIAKARQQHGDRLAVLILPVPLHPSCNPLVAESEPEHEHACELARLALAVWRGKPGAFEAFDAWLFASPATRTPADARAKAAELMGLLPLEAALADPWIDRQIGRNADAFRYSNVTGLPAVLVGGRSLEPPLTETDVLNAVAEQVGRGMP